MPAASARSRRRYRARMMRRASAPAATGTAYARWAPHASMAQPATAEPPEIPMRMPVTATAMPSVTSALGTSFWARDRLVMSMGAVAEPATTMTTTSGHSPPTKRAGTSRTNIAAAAMARRRVRLVVKILVPKTMPAIVDPRAKPPRMTLEKLVLPSSLAKATAMTSFAPKMTPVMTRAVATTRSPGRRIARPPGRSPCGTTGGSVARADRKATQPPVNRIVARISPASGNQSVETRTASTGPRTKDASSATCSKAIAVCRRSGSSRKMCAQRARDIGPGSGRIALSP